MTPGLVVAAWRVLPAQYGARVELKATSPTMAGAAAVLEALGYQDRATFARFTTTLQDVIFTPFTPGTPTPDYGLVAQLAVLAHELVHVQQYSVQGATFLGLYAQAASARALYEAAGYRAGETVRRALGQPPAGPDQLAGHLAAYGMPAADIAVARAFHASSLASMAEGAVLDRPAADVIRFVASYTGA